MKCRKLGNRCNPKINIRQPIEKIDVEGYEKLKFAIVELAVRDYKVALARHHKSIVSDLEKFFLSEWGQGLSGWNGDIIICEIKKRSR